MKKVNLLETNDTQVWAKEFVKCKRKNKWTLDDIDESLMIAWFANAMTAQKFANKLDRLDTLLNPRLWTEEMSKAWHKNIPDILNAFSALRECGVQHNNGMLAG